MESVESPLEVLSRAATMMQRRHAAAAYPAASDSDGFESPSTASGGESDGEGEAVELAPAPAPLGKQLPSAAWRRERRSARLPHYKPRESGNKALRSQSFNERRSAGAAAAARAERAGRAARHSDGEAADPPPAAAPHDARGAPPEYPSEAPIDMRLKSRPGPPPPYAPVAAAAAPAAAPPTARASVITRSQLDAPPATGSISMCDPVIDEHFRRSLGDDYMTLFARKPPPAAAGRPARPTRDRGSSPIAFPADAAPAAAPTSPPAPAAPKSLPERALCEDAAMEVDSASSSVDDHFAKALGDTWKKIQISRLEADKPEKEKLARRGVAI